MIPLQASPGDPFGLGIAFVFGATLLVLAWMMLTLRSAVISFAFAISSVAMGLYLVDLIPYDVAILSMTIAVAGSALLAIVAWRAI